jgi:probable HAF family extracellular repeat protein
MRVRSLNRLGVIGITVGLLAAARVDALALVDLGTLGGFSYASGINDAGQIVGLSTNSRGWPRAFLVTDGVMTDLDSGRPLSSGANAINATGQVVGWMQVIVDFLYDYTARHAFLYSGSGMMDLGTLEGTGESRANDINNAGQVVGWSQPEGGNQHAFLYSSGTMIDLGTLGGSKSEARSINDSGEIVGWSMIAGDTETHAFLYKDGIMTDLTSILGGPGRADSINNSGQIAATQIEADDSQAMLISGSVATVLGTPGTSSAASGINEAGQVVGTIGPGTGHACVYTNGTTIDLGTLGGETSFGFAINRAGDAVGYSDTAAAGHAFLSRACPLAASTRCLECPVTSSTSCLVARSSSFQLRYNADDTKDQMQWKWDGGAAFQASDLGSPVDRTTYRLCMYNASGEPLTTLAIEPNTNWFDHSSRGWTYNDPTAANDGVYKLFVRPGEAMTSSLQLRSHGANLPLPVPYSDQAYFPEGIIVQLFNDATPTCWSSQFDSAMRNDAEHYKAKAP